MLSQNNNFQKGNDNADLPIPDANIVTHEMASKIKKEKYKEKEKKEKEKAEEKKRIMVDKLYKQSIKVIEKWIYDENDCSLDIRYYPVVYWCYFLPLYCNYKEKGYLENVIILIQKKIGNAYEVSLDYEYYSCDCLIRVRVV